MKEDSSVSLKVEWRDYSLDFTKRTYIMGVLNVTPDSFSDGGQFFDTQKAAEHAFHMAGQGADIIDVGGESTRPYSRKISANEEMDRVMPVLEAICKELTIPVSIDTRKAVVAREAVRVGASMINDISALRSDPEMAEVAAKSGIPLILMHMKGTPSNMQNNPTYGNLMQEIIGFLKDAINRAVDGGVEKEKIIVDPGIGFGKTFDHNLQIIRSISMFSVLERPVLLGTSRKAFLGHILGKEAAERDLGTMATIVAGILNGAHIVRVHNVRMAVETVKVADAIKRGKAA